MLFAFYGGHVHIGHPTAIKYLNALLKNRLTAINQHFLHARILKHQGNLELADYQYKTSIEAMRHADMLVEHILARGGIPCMQKLGKLRIGTNANEMLQNDLLLAQEGESIANNLIFFCSSKYSETVELLDKICTSQKQLIEYVHSCWNPAEGNFASAFEQA